uniref:Uncharacterized protein n=1 Tax=Glossina palpalis gambiensis TaxID=67801 RepID=A0A1B0B3P5_9MUSC
MMTKTKISFEFLTGSFHYTISIEGSVKSPSKRWIVFLARKAVRRAAGFGFQHSSITLLRVDKILFSCHDADMMGRKPWSQTVIRITSMLGSSGTSSTPYGSDIILSSTFVRNSEGIQKLEIKKRRQPSQQIKQRCLCRSLDLRQSDHEINVYCVVWRSETIEYEPCRLLTEPSSQCGLGHRFENRMMSFFRQNNDNKKRSNCLQAACCTNNE